MRASWVAALFKRFQARYGSKWVSNIDGIEEDAIKEWGIGLAGVTAKQIKFGLDTWKSDWPPSMDEFVKVCKNTQAQFHQPFPKLEVLKSTKETGKEAIDNMKRLYLGRGE